MSTVRPAHRAYALDLKPQLVLQTKSQLSLNQRQTILEPGPRSLLMLPRRMLKDDAERRDEMVYHVIPFVPRLTHLRELGSRPERPWLVPKKERFCWYKRRTPRQSPYE
jgi:hypothetical protein